MGSTFGILFPVFALISIGFALRRGGVFGPAASSELNRFVVWLALPALLFDIMANASAEQLDQPGFIAAFSIACAATFLLVLLARLFAGAGLADASVDAIAGAYPNTGYIGFPLCLIAFGAASLAPTMIATIIVACVLFAVAIVLVEVAAQRGGGAGAVLAKVCAALARNPLIVAPVAGRRSPVRWWRWLEPGCRRPSSAC